MFPLFSYVRSFGAGGLSFSWPGCDLRWNQYCEGEIGLLQIGQFWWSHLWLPMKLGWIVKLHLSHLFFSKIVLNLVLDIHNKGVLIYQLMLISVILLWSHTVEGDSWPASTLLINTHWLKMDCISSPWPMVFWEV